MRVFWIFFFLLSLSACENDRTDRNPFLQEVGFSFSINLNLPRYSPLTIVGNAVYIPTNGVGIRGVFVMNVGANQFRAFEANCPNHVPNDCSTMILEVQTVSCPCDDFEYSLFTGQQLNRPDDGNRYYDMLEYRARFGGTTVVISN
ncbi:MAG: hypothetical protein AAFX53_06870 [Bacteroidota bacterium]